MNEVEKMYENANVKPEYRYDCNLADTIKPTEVFPLCSCSKGEIKDYCTSKQDYRYCKVYKVNKIYPPFTAEKQIAAMQILFFNNKAFSIGRVYPHNIIQINNDKYVGRGETFGEALAEIINKMWQDLTATEREEIKEILKG